MHIADAIWRNSYRWPQRTALVQQGRAISYSGLRVTVEKLMARLTGLGVVPQSCVAISCADAAANVSLVLALARMGAVSTPLNAAWPAELRRELLERNRVSFYLRDDQEAARDAVPVSVPQITIGSLFSDLDAQALVASAVALGDDEQVWRVALSSGTTGTPKSIGWTHGACALRYALSLGANSAVDQSALLVFADMGMGLCLGRALIQLSGGGTLVVPANATPQEFFAVLQRDQPTHLLTTPAIAGTIVAVMQRQRLTRAQVAPGLTSITLGGSVVAPALMQQITGYLCPQVRLSYGATETGELALTDAALLAAEPASAGRLAPWVQAQAVDAADQVLEPGSVGLLRFRSVAMVSGYLDDAQASAKAFRDGWYYPGDLGSVDLRGHLTLTGRADHRINLQGVKIDPQEVERVLGQYPGVQEAGVVALQRTDGVPALVAALVTDEVALDRAALQQWCRQHGSDAAVPRQFVELEALPRTPMGKLDRAALQDAVLAQLQRLFEDTGPAPLGDD